MNCGHAAFRLNSRSAESQGSFQTMKQAIGMKRPEDRSRWLRSSVTRLLAALAGSAAVALLAGFGLFVHRLDWVEPTRLHETDGAVVLTGGADRISDAVSLVAKGYAARLLITGVNQSTSSAEIARLTPKFEEYFACCVDLGYAALNTEGNAEETRLWAQARAMRSLTVVTSNYHMPRALLEIHAALPDVALTRFSVVPEQARASSWLLEPQMLKLLGVEYLKYLRAAVRMTLYPPPLRDSPGTATASR